MACKSKYKSKNYEALLCFLKTIPNQHITVAEISDYFRKNNTPMGTTTIYRQLERMIEEGLVNKYVIDENSGSCFEYIESDNHCHHPACLHCKCEICGKLIHIGNQDFLYIQEYLQEKHSFELKAHRTILYGICDTCKKEGN